MHPFIMKVTVAAVVLTIASVASASQVRSDTSALLSSDWYSTYDKPVYKDVQKVPTAKIIIHKGNAKHAHRYVTKKHGKRVLRKRIKHEYYNQQPRRRNVHASGYSW